ncbi:MAG: TetR/AcrR family transcriptional regulator [Woeseiaceae bacterium]|nr:TetR/AcrR family transcriptional regulator [Woeseiaceae bacterium]
MSRSEQRIPKLRSRGRANREKLLRCAEQMLADNNGRAWRFSDVFEAAGVSRGSAYRIYNGIDDLMHDLAADWVQNFVQHLATVRPEQPPETWMQLTDFIIKSGAEYWAMTKNRLRAMPRVRSNAPASYKAAVKDLSDCLARLYDRYFHVPDIPDWHDKLAFATQLVDFAYSDAVRKEGAINGDRLREAQTLAKTYFGFYLPPSVPPRERPRARSLA